MTTKRSYECNLCRGSVSADSGRGFKFGAGRVEWTTLYDAENHICDACISSLVVSFRDKGIVEQFGDAG